MRSPSKAQGYWNQPSLTADIFNAFPSTSSSSSSPSSSDNGFLRTGDLGFLHEGELFICGRSKDLIIVRGTNHFPQDIEKSAEDQILELRPGCSAAFSLPNDSHGTEKVVYVAEVCTCLPHLLLYLAALSLTFLALFFLITPLY